MEKRFLHLHPPNREGTDTTLCPKKAVITGRMRDCYISKKAADRPGRPSPMPGFKQVSAGWSYSRIYQGTLSEKHRHISTSEAVKAIDIFPSLQSVVLHDSWSLKGSKAEKKKG